MADQHVVPLASGWGVRPTTSREVDKVFESQAEAIDYARQKAEEETSALFLQEVDGTITKLEDYHPETYPVEIESVLIDNEYKTRDDDTQ